MKQALGSWRCSLPRARQPKASNGLTSSGVSHQQVWPHVHFRTQSSQRQWHGKKLFVPRSRLTDGNNNLEAGSDKRHICVETIISSIFLRNSSVGNFSGQHTRTLPTGVGSVPSELMREAHTLLAGNVLVGNVMAQTTPHIVAVSFSRLLFSWEEPHRCPRRRLSAKCQRPPWPRHRARWRRSAVWTEGSSIRKQKEVSRRADYRMDVSQNTLALTGLAIERCN